MKQLDQNDNIDPVILNENFREVQTLISRASAFNQALRKRDAIQTMILSRLALKNLALDDITSISQTLTGNSSKYYFPASIMYKHKTNSERISLDTGLLGLEPIPDSEVSLVSTQLNNEFGDRIPSSNTQYQIDNSVDELSMPELIFSPDSVWAQRLSQKTVIITATFPAGLQNRYNFVKSLGIIEGTSLSWKKQTPSVVNQVGYFPESFFDYQFILKSTGIADGDAFLHTIGMVDIGFREFPETGNLEFLTGINKTDHDSISTLEMMIPFDLSKQQLSQIMRIELIPKVSGSLSEPIYNSDVDTYPLASSITVPANTDDVMVRITMRRYSNSSALIQGMTLTVLNVV